MLRGVVGSERERKNSIVMNHASSQLAAVLAWLERNSFFENADGRWLHVLDSGDSEWLTSSEVGYHCAGKILDDDELDKATRFSLCLGLLDLLREYMVATRLRWATQAGGEPEWEALLWAEYRRRLESEQSADEVIKSLFDWFEEPEANLRAFRQTIESEVTELCRRSTLLTVSKNESLLRRFRRVLPVTGPLPWRVKHPVYRKLSIIPDLHDEIFMAVRASQHDLFGDMPAEGGLELVESLDAVREQTARAEMIEALERRQVSSD
ncbi:hypothetical protein [Amycolatopsis sp. VC5-11]|uniref:hypothetical protein n=1 Tax=Amycolatopsis sp. VC5-11 TaxID=3120156 RepID=UPI00300ABE9D